MTEQHEWGMGVDWAQSGGGKTCATIVRKDTDGVVTIMEVLHGEVAEYLANLFNEYETLKRGNADLLDVVLECVNFLADLNTTSLSPEMLRRGISLHKRAYTAHSKAKSSRGTLKGEQHEQL